MFLVINGTEQIECSKAEKGNDYIKLFDENGNATLTFKGIADFSKFTLDGGDFSKAPLTEIEEIQIALAELAELMLEE